MALAEHVSIVLTGRLQSGAFAAADLAWEQVQEAGVRNFRAGRSEAAVRHFGRGSTIAGQHFEPTDPRLATSLTNADFAFRQRGEVTAARRHFAQASEVFAAGSAWIWRIKPAGRPAPTYDAAVLSSVGLLERWHLERPFRASDLRKLLGAALLMVSRAGA